jgi:Putative Actinobacterial Holin-X, holin superfamily III
MPSRDALHRLLDGLQTLIREHLALARVELKQDLRTMGRDLATGATGLPALATGYLLFMVALASLISR